jgi:Xaa-Pro aminopeptidase
VETMQGALKNGRNVLDWINMPQAEFDSHVAGIRETMRKEALDLLLIYSYAFDSYGDVAYITNFITRLPRGSLVALPVEGQPALFFDGSSRGIPSYRKTVSDADIIAVSDMVRDSLKYLTERSLLKGRIGLVGLRQLMPYAQFKALKEALSGCTVAEVKSVVADRRLLKSAREQDEIRRASRTLHEIFEGVRGFSFPSLNEHSIQAFLYREARYEGAEDVRALVGKAVGENWYLGPAEKRPIDEGQTVSLYLALEFERYWAEAARTFRVENGSLVPADQVLEDVYRESSEIVKARQTGSEVYASIVQRLKSRGFEMLADYGLGYGVGLAPEEPPWIAETEGTRLTEGMTMALHLVVKNKDAGVLMKGETLLVTDAAPVVLT